MKKILIKNFKNLNNYGSGMMGLVTISKLYNLLDKKVEFYSDLDKYAEYDQILKELNEDIILKVFNDKDKFNKRSNIPVFNKLQTLKRILSNKGAENFDMLIVLGGDDLSEYYGKHVWPLLLSFYSWSYKTKVVLLGQSIGPFNFLPNRLIFKKLAQRCKIYSRDKFCFDYLKNDLGIKKNITLSGDLAFLDLPLQKSIEYQNEILNKFKLTPNSYICIVISGLFGKYYTSNKEDYFDSFKKLISVIKSNPALKDKKICFLAHTFPPHGNEAELLNEFENYINDIDGLVFIKDKIYQGAARFILGNGLFTITGRMHASVSTFQMEKPSISLAYSVKYRGVIGENLNQSNLIIEANNPELWRNKEIVNIISDKINFILNNYDNLVLDIKQNIEQQKTLVNKAFNDLLKDI
ncbi:polysaccharide pyruvyl transferase family protein [Thalassobellus sediminis]|uniref:polysaccharide pyruvyl transferase family protein n=1 Tax=Thalassobellus sediminis TaxID=3367753 RepID=UPI003793AE7C